VDPERESIDMMGRSTFSRRSILQAAGAATALCATPVWGERAAVWPDRPVRLIVPYPAGGSTDVLFRLLAERLQDKLNQPFVVENRAGASGNVGIDAVAKSMPDGYMIGGATVGHFSINQFLIAKMPYDAEKDLVAPSLTFELPNVAVVAAQHVTAKTLGEFIEWAKARSNGISIGSPGPGTTPHLSGVLFAARKRRRAASASRPRPISGRKSARCGRLSPERRTTHESTPAAADFHECPPHRSTTI
jgi:tripartite-type tricarboxylate transporter receptor subunit TctC